ncbi:hypothetical protein [Medusavirus stheno T3]|uniref:Uncharacterized protein n=1 Tax=Medusavirus stheno T3 TaxID=3069717 RepID=A0A7S7YEW6_9VIRU|nr:hypothetical protein QKU73_gp242 [Acanthamoeba castellanii medusavirus]QPB44533.1 hypothetical protein [Medusavirus stheno T3]
MATIRQVEAPIPVYQCYGCKDHFEVPPSCLKTIERQEEVRHKIYETFKSLGWECPNCGRENDKPKKKNSRW